MTNALATMTVNEMMTVGGVLAESNFFQDTRQQAQAVAKIMAGAELGIGPVASLTGINIIQNRLSLGANLIAACVKRSGKYDYIVKTMTHELCEIEFFQYIDGKRTSIGISPFSIADARKAGTKNLDKFARNMLFARAMSNGARWYTPDVFNGPVYTPEELGANVNEEGDVIDVTPQPQAVYVDPLADERAAVLDEIKFLFSKGTIDKAAARAFKNRSDEAETGDDLQRLMDEINAISAAKPEQAAA